MEQILATCGAAYAAADPAGNAWTIGNAVIRKTLAWRDDTGLCLAALEHRATGHTWRPQLPVDDRAGGEFALRWNDAVLSARQATALRSVRAEADAATVTLYVDLRVADALDITLCLRARSDTAVLEQWLEVTTRQPGVLSRVAPLTVSLAGLAAPVLHWVRGLQGHGAGMPDSGPYPAFQVRHEPLGAVALESGLRSTWHEIAWFALDGDDGDEGLFVGLSYSGRWSAAARAVDGGAILDVYSDGYATPLAAGERWISPTSFVGLYRGDLDDAAHVQHQYMRAAVMLPPPPISPGCSTTPGLRT
jgi:hypothetical protein